MYNSSMSDYSLNVTDAWKARYPGSCVGILAMRGVNNPDAHPAIEDLKRSKENELRAKFEGQDRATLKQLDRIQAYESYYGIFGQQYHVLLQLESIALKQKPFASKGALVQVMFVAEVGNLILTAGHDLDSMKLPLVLDIAEGTEEYLSYNGKPHTAKKDDMIISDSEAVTSSIVLGPDQRTRIHSGTENVLFACYAPVGIGAEAMRLHLEEMQSGALLISPEATTELLEVYEA